MSNDTVQFLLVATMRTWRFELWATLMRPNLSERKTLRKSVSVGVRNKCRLQDIADALMADGYTSLDAQAKALGIHRATAWTIIKTNRAACSMRLRCIDMNPSYRADTSSDLSVGALSG